MAHRGWCGCLTGASAHLIASTFHNVTTPEPDRTRIRHPLAKRKAKEAHKGQAVVDQILGSFVGQIVGRLDDKHLEHHHRIKRGTSALRPVRVGQRSIQGGAEDLDVDRGRKRFQLIAQIAEPLQPILDVKEPSLPAHLLHSSNLGNRPRASLKREGS